MKQIEVSVIQEAGNPAAMMSFLARLTQRGANISSMSDLKSLMERPTSTQLVESMMALDNHHTIRRFTPITVAIVGASRRFLAQIRTHSVGLNFVSASLQYSDYTGKARFVVPYSLLDNGVSRGLYLDTCEKAMQAYAYIAADTDNDTAGYASPQGLRNILIMQGNHDAWLHVLALRTCNRNTVETQYVVTRIWEELLKTQDGESMFKYAGPDCMFGPCKEGKLCCGSPMRKYIKMAEEKGVSIPRAIIMDKWPLLEEVNE